MDGTTKQFASMGSIEQVDGGFAITGIHLDTQGKVPDIEESEFLRHAEIAKENCPVSKALAATKIDMKAALTALAAR